MSELPSTALVTGGSRGIGEACAKRLAKDGFEVIITYVSRPDGADKVCAEIEAAGGKARSFKLDSSDRDAVSAFFKEEIKGKVKLDVLVNNAGITRDGLLVRMKDEDWDKVLDINLTGAFTCLRESAKIMMKQRFGRIINISSVVGQAGNAGQANYVSAKAGLIGLTKASAIELAPRGVTVNAVTPGFIQTDMTAELPEKVMAQMMDNIPLKKLGTSDDIANAVSFLAKEESGYITGQTLAVNGGMYM
ncbi:3-oxoacyl-[acyl-carrier-protein] reductase [Desulfovibrio sp. JC010]|uniref:3-oxoacyl-[acyl-carrier-protein] reductase n=1 Tax=Desulfovibrio sp. JC010 TaxID=2593641 RepID=UPI0013D36EC3|nr:3-oxoacyl-[acyl-carrier-protein] reductase [Desulfovibrio sp. JC010]NDV26592.1 3-oxoacyl-[acyl-carrier-protein] reductase [Desulfovibrio sp. JC010]